MGKYAAYLTDKYRTENEIAKLLEKYGDVIDKYQPGLSLDMKVETAKVIAHNTLDSWVSYQKQQKRKQQQKQLIRAFKSQPSARSLAKYMAFRAKHSLVDFASDASEFAGDAAVSVVTVSDIKEVRKDRERSEKEKIVATQLESQQGLYSAGQGPGVFFRKGLLGEPIVIVKKGVDLTPEGLTPATRNGAPIHCFTVTQRGISVVKKRGSLRKWFEDHASHFLVRIEDSDASDITGQDRSMTEVDKILQSPWPPLAEIGTIGVTVETWKGLYLEEDQYEVIDPGLLVVKHFADRAGGIAKTGAEAVLKAPNEIAEALRGAKELAEPLMQAVEGLFEFLKKEDDKDNLAAVQVTFSPTIGTPLKCEVASTSRFVVHGSPARGVLIGDIMEQVLNLAGA